MRTSLVLVLLVVLTVAGQAAELLDLAPFARPCCSADRHTAQTLFDYNHPRGVVRHADGRWVYGLQWAEERDLFEVRVRFRGQGGIHEPVLQYWFLNWPYDPPHMPAIEDPVDDPWQGSWVPARTDSTREGRQLRIHFAPLAPEENRRASNLPGVRYRRAVRFRLLWSAGKQPEVEKVQVFSESTVRPFALRVQFEGTGSGAPRFRAYNGAVIGVEPTRGGALLTVNAADPRPAGSNDVTIVEIRRGQDVFSFSPIDAGKGPMYIADFGACILPAASTGRSCKDVVKRGAKIRERLAAEPEQTFERASSEIPPLDPVERQGGPLYLPLAAEASWQKFAFEWGGNVFISKRGTKAMGRELERLTWPKDRIDWRIGTGEAPSFRPKSGDSTLSMLEDHLPVAIAKWSEGGVDYQQEAFATLLSGPLSPDDAARSEQTPAVLMMKIRARNSAAAGVAHLWIGMRPGEALAFDGRLLTPSDGASIRAAVSLPAGAVAETGTCLDGGIEMPALHVRIPLEAKQETVTCFRLPFIPRLTGAERKRLAELDYATERARVVEYWRGLTAKGAPFTAPEPRFLSFAKGLPARIRISATKDPKSGLYMAPAASYGYLVFANEASFQTQLLDLFGEHRLAEQYLETLVRLQGSKPFRGSFTGDQKAVYHGARVDAEYDYTASEYNLDHGTVLWTLAQHYFYTRDRAWLGRVAPGMKRAADWIVEQRGLTKAMTEQEQCPEFGLLPAGNLEDNSDWAHWFSVNAYASAGMTALAQALADAGDPDAARYREEADLYRADLRAAVLRAAAAAPVIRLRDNSWVPYVPTRAHQRIRLFGPLRVGYYSRYPEKVLPTYRLSATRELLYGPTILLDTGIFDVEEPVAAWVLDDWEDNTTMSEPLGIHVHGWVDEQYWFSRGGMVFQANLQNPVRAYMRRGEIPAAIRGLYNGFVSCYYPSVNVFTEEYRQWRGPSGPFYKIPDEAKFVLRLREFLVLEHGGDLQLAAGTPRRWLTAGQRIEVKDAPTQFGLVSYTLEPAADEVRGEIRLPDRNPWKEAWISIRLPEGRAIRSVTIDGKEWKDVDRERERIRLPKTGKPLKLVVSVRMR